LAATLSDLLVFAKAARARQYARETLSQPRADAAAEERTGYLPGPGSEDPYVLQEESTAMQELVGT
jgi:hypothetical protein